MMRLFFLTLSKFKIKFLELELFSKIYSFIKVSIITKRVKQGAKKLFAVIIIDPKKKHI